MAFLLLECLQKGVCGSERPVGRPERIRPTRFDQFAFVPLKLLSQNLNQPNLIKPGQSLDFR